MRLVPEAQLSGKQFKLVNGSYGAVPVPEITGSMEKQTLLANGGEDIGVKKNGYLYVYVSNASKGNVYFDDLSVVHTRGPLLEETHYYPFGLAMAGISSKAVAFGNPGSKYKFGDKELQNEEFSDGTGLEAYDFDARMYDPQIGRMWQVDPWAEKYERQSPYAGFNDNPIMFADPTGKGGELTVVKDEKTGEWYLKVTAKIYIYSKKGVDEARKHASKIQNEIMTQWNNPTETDDKGNPVDEGAQGYGRYGTMKGRVVFDVSVEAVSIEFADETAATNTDLSINFMGLDADDQSHASGNSGEFNLQQLYSRKSTAAHEFGHLLGYYNSNNLNYANRPKDGKDAFDTHATYTPEEQYFIMQTKNIIGDNSYHSKQRVDPTEYSRLNHGRGISTNSANKIVPLVVDPEGAEIGNNIKNLTNRIYK